MSETRSPYFAAADTREIDRLMREFALVNTRLSDPPPPPPPPPPRSVKGERPVARAVAPTGQARRMSAIEAACSTAIGFGIAYLTSYLVLPLFGFPVTAGQNLGIVCIFTVVSLVRGYFVRRLFNRFGEVRP